MSIEPCDLPATDLAAAYLAGAISPVEATRSALGRIEALNDQINAYVFVDAAGALAQARAAEHRWRAGEPLSPVDGLPCSVKELLPAVGWPLRRCSRALEPGQISTEDAPAVARLREGGAVLLGKTNSPEFGWKGTTDNPVFGASANPWHRGRTAGGSSGGAAAAAALGMGVLHIGTDGGGSIRIPAAFSGVFGLKPTFGRVPVYPLSKFGTTSHAGPMSRTVADSARMMEVIARPDPRDWHALPADEGGWLAALNKGVEGLRIAYSPTLGFAKVDPEVAALVETAARLFERLGAHVELVDQVMGDPTDLFRKVWATGAAATVRAFPREARSVMDPGLVALAEYGEGLDHMTYMDADHDRGLLGAAMKQFHQTYDLLLTPAEPVEAFSIDQQVASDGQRDWIDWTPFTFPFNLTGQPAASVPCGLTRAGLPVGLQVVGDRYSDRLVLSACQAFEAAFGVLPPPPMLRPAS